MIWEYLLIGSAFGAFIGYLANRIAVWMLFHPIKPLKIGPVVMQGIFPKKKREIAERIALVISEKVMSGEEIIKLTTEAVEKELSQRKLFFPFPSFTTFREVINAIVKATVTNFMKSFLFLKGTEENINIKEYILEKFDEFSNEEFEKVFKEAVGKELNYISINDAIIGGVVGIIEVSLLTILHI